MHSFFEETLGDLEVCKKFYPGRTYYIYGFGTFTSKPILSSTNAKYDRLCVLVDVDGHFMWVEDTFIYNIYLFTNKETATKLKVQKSTDYRETIRKLASPIVSLDTIQKYFVPHPRPALNSTLLTWFEKKKAKLIEELPADIQELVRHRPREINPEPERSTVFNKRQIRKFSAGELPNPIIPPFIFSEPTSVLSTSEPPPIILRCFNLAQTQNLARCGLDEEPPEIASNNFKTSFKEEDLAPPEEIPEDMELDAKTEEPADTQLSLSSSTGAMEEMSDLPPTPNEKIHTVKPTVNKYSNNKTEESKIQKALKNVIKSESSHNLDEPEMSPDVFIYSILLFEFEHTFRLLKLFILPLHILTYQPFLSEPFHHHSIGQQKLVHNALRH